MRIISGKLRGRQFDTPSGDTTRPTGDKVRGALFNILQSRLQGARVLDGFAGSGALSFEALSRGAASATLFETDAAAAALLRQNALKLGIAGQCDIRKQDFLVGAAALGNAAYDIVFLDPPYGAGLLEKVITFMDWQGLLAPGGIIVAEYSAANNMPADINGLAAYDSRIYGITALIFYRRQDSK